MAARPRGASRPCQTLDERGRRPTYGSLPDSRLDAPEVDEFVEPFGREEVLGGRRVVAHELVELLVELVFGEPEVFVEGSLESEGPNILVKADEQGLKGRQVGEVEVEDLHVV